MDRKTLKALLLVTFVLYCVGVDLVKGASIANAEDRDSKLSVSSVFVDDVVVESTLSVKRKPNIRQGRTGPGLTLKPTQNTLPKKVDGSTLVKLERSKRQSRRRYPNSGGFPGGFPQQQFNGGFPQQQFNGGFPQFEPIRGSASSAAAQAQGFQSNSPFGNFGASAANAGSQGFSYGENGFSGNAGLSGSQSYNLPNGNTLAISYTNGFSIGPDGKPTVSKGNSIAYTGSDGQPIQGFQGFQG